MTGSVRTLPLPRPARGPVMTEAAFALRRQRRAMLSWVAAVAFYTALLMSVWPAMHRSGSIQDYVDSLPKGLIRAFGITDLTTAAGYLGGELFSFILPLLLTAAAVTTTVTLTAAYEEAGYFETLLTLPITRTRMLLARGLAALAGLAVVGVALYAVLSGVGRIIGMDVAQSRLAAGTVAVTALAALHGAVAYLGAGLGIGRTRALGLAAGTAVLGYAMYSLLPQVSALSGVVSYSPWDWTIGQDPLRTGLPVKGMLLALGFITALVTAGTAAFNRRDVGLA